MAVARYYDHDLGEWVLLAAGRDGASGASSWDELTGKPATFPPESHTHSQSEVDGLEAALSGKAESSRVAALEGSQPIIVSSLPSSPLPGRIYLVTG